MSTTTISPTRLAELWKQDSSIEVIDVRTPGEYRAQHLEFARNVPLDQLDPAAVMAARNGSKEPLYVVCQSGGRSQKACQAFEQAGYTNIVNVEGGTAACCKTELPIIKGSKTIALDRQVRITAGSLVLLGIAGFFLHPACLGLSAFVGAGLVFSGVTDTCGMGMVLARMPWNR